jgi:hypothetical protein
VLQEKVTNQVTDKRLQKPFFPGSHRPLSIVSVKKDTRGDDKETLGPGFFLIFRFLCRVFHSYCHVAVATWEKHCDKENERRKNQANEVTSG